MSTAVSAKNTKNEILEAYEQLLRELAEKKETNPRKEQEENKKQATLKSVEAFSNESIVKGFASLKLEIATSMEKLEAEIKEEYQKLEQVQQAIAIERKNLEDLYHISANADSLAALILAQKSRKEQFEGELETRKTEFDKKMQSERLAFDTETKEQRELWKKEKTASELQIKEAAELLKKNRLREEEEYKYSLQQNRKKEEDAYQTKAALQEKELIDKKASLEAEFAVREAKIAEAENELDRLRKEVELFPEQLTAAISAAENSLNHRLATEHKYEVELTKKQHDGDIKLLRQTIDTLQAKIKDQDNFIKELSTKANLAEANVKDIAVKAIESSGKMQIIEKTKEG